MSRMRPKEEEMLNGVEVLIVEDSPVQAELLRQTLEKNGGIVSHAINGREALDMLKEHKPDLVITDILMPEMDGYELTRRIKADEDLKEVPVMLLTVLTDPLGVIKGLESGAEDFVPKPYHEEHLLSRIKRMFVNRELRKSGRLEAETEVYFGGEKYQFTAGRTQVIDFLLSTYETAVMKNEQLEQEIEVRKRAEEELRRVNVELEGYAHTVSHDLKGPLTAIELAATLFEELLKEPITDETRGKLTEIAESLDLSVVESTDLIEDLLALAEAGQVPRDITDVDVADVVSRILEEKAGDLKEKNIKVKVSEDLGHVMAKRTQIYQLFTNIIGNAIKHCRSEAPVIEVSHLGDDDGAHRYLVRDNGEGIPPGDLDSVFEPFFKGKSGGTGIGLATVAKIVNVYEGSIRAYNEDGACFEFTICDLEK